MLPSDAADALKGDKHYLELWGGSPQAETVRVWEKEDTKKYEDYNRRIEEDRGYQELLEEVAAFVKANKFLRRNKPTTDSLENTPTRYIVRKSRNALATWKRLGTRTNGRAWWISTKRIQTALRRPYSVQISTSPNRRQGTGPRRRLW